MLALPWDLYGITVVPLSGSPKKPLQSAPRPDFSKPKSLCPSPNIPWKYPKTFICLGDLTVPFWLRNYSLLPHPVASFHKDCTPDPVCRMHVDHADYVEQLKGLFCVWVAISESAKMWSQLCGFQASELSVLLSSPYVSNISVTITFIYQSLCYFDFL